MKLYATVTSERATKGQGGEYLAIKITDKDKNLIWHIYIEDNRLDLSEWNEEQKRAKLILRTFHENIPIEKEAYKAKKQRGEKKCECATCSGIPF